MACTQPTYGTHTVHAWHGTHQVLMAILLYSVSSAVGQNFVYFTVTEFGPLILTTVTTVRKIFSTLYSVFRTPSNTLSPMQWGGCSMVFAGLLGDIMMKMMPKPTSTPKAAPAVEQAPPDEASGAASSETPPATTLA